jgi:hypothetical protein
MKMRTTKYTKDTKKELLSGRTRHSVRAATIQRRAEDCAPYQKPVFAYSAYFAV